MLKDKSSRLAVSGSLAFDQIMDFPGVFSAHILPNQVHNLNVSFSVRSLRQSYGGTAGNIAYNLSLLKLKPTILGIVGFDFLAYAAWLEKRGVDLGLIKTVAGSKSSSAFIITDKGDNQISAFYGGPHLANYAKSIKPKLRNFDLAIISPDNKLRMIAYAAIYRQHRVPYIFDPGQALTSFSSAELRRAIKGAKVLIGNDYEIKLITNILKINFRALVGYVDILVVTKGGQGSEIYQGDKKIAIKSAKPKTICDPTGAGDAYRAGLIYGLIQGYNLKTCGQLAGLSAVYTVEKFGTQTHTFSVAEFRKRYYQNYGEKIN